MTIRAGDEIHISAQGIHRDPQHYPDPLRFNPENFSKENRARRNPCTFMGFGQGPRNCMGMRFALLEIKIAMIRILRSYSLMPSPRTPEKLTKDPGNILGMPLEPVLVKAVAREHQG